MDTRWETRLYRRKKMSVVAIPEHLVSAKHITFHLEPIKRRKCDDTKESSAISFSKRRQMGSSCWVYRSTVYDGLK